VLFKLARIAAVLPARELPTKSEFLRFRTTRSFRACWHCSYKEKELERRWHIVRVTANSEKKVADQLTARSVENFLPQIVQESKWSDRTVTIGRPLFPGYVFARFSRMEKVLVQSAPGVIRSGVGEEIPDAELDRIRTALDEGWKLAPHVGRPEGRRVRFRGGIFSGVEGTGVQVGTNLIVVVSLSGSRESFSIEAKFEDVELF
jgi:transcription termination/antitermination protein NusG